MCFKRKNKYTKCPICNGKGYTHDGIWNKKCVRCDGTKNVLKSKDESKTCGTCDGKLD